MRHSGSKFSRISIRCAARGHLSSQVSDTLDGGTVNQTRAKEEKRLNGEGQDSLNAGILDFKGTIQNVLSGMQKRSEL